MNIGVNLSQEKLRCLLMIDDELIEKFIEDAGEAWFRAFIVEDRVTHQLTLRFRFRYVDHDNWYEAALPDDRPFLAAVNEVKLALVSYVNVVSMITDTDEVMAVQDFYPPDDHGDGGRTVAWLAANDLIKVPKRSTCGKVQSPEGPPAAIQ